MRFCMPAKGSVRSYQTTHSSQKESLQTMQEPTVMWSCIPCNRRLAPRMPTRRPAFFEQVLFFVRSRKRKKKKGYTTSRIYIYYILYYILYIYILYYKNIIYVIYLYIVIYIIPEKVWNESQRNCFALVVTTWVVPRLKESHAAGKNDLQVLFQKENCFI